MGCDMVVALNSATVQGNTLFGLNHHDAGPARHELCRLAGVQHAPDEVLRCGSLTIPQARKTSTVLGSRPCGAWGLTHGINEHRLAAGYSCWQSKLPPSETGLLGTDLVRLTLERSQSARQALDLLTDLLGRHGQRGSGQPGRTDSIFLLADPKEAFVIEAAGSYWAMLECQQVRAVSDVGLIRQDWRRLSPGLAELAISRGWWADDGSKLDVCGSLANAPTASASWSLRRWGKATLALEQQSGHIDPYILRLILGEHYESAAATRPVALDSPGQRLQMLTSFLAVLSADVHTVPFAWCTYGPSAYPLYFPILLDGELPQALTRHLAEESSLLARLEVMLRMPEHVEAVKEMLDKLQDQFDQQLEELLEPARSVSVKGNLAQLQRLAGFFMQNQWDAFEAEVRRLASLESEAFLQTVKEDGLVGMDQPARLRERQESSLVDFP
jgi:hypothetical protein